MSAKTTKSKKNKVILQKPILTAEGWKRKHTPKVAPASKKKKKS